MIPSDDHTKQVNLYTRHGAGIWRIIAYCPEPSITMENVVTGARENFGLSGATAGTFDPIYGFAWNHKDGQPVNTNSVRAAALAMQPPVNPNIEKGGRNDAE